MLPLKTADQVLNKARYRLRKAGAGANIVLMLHGWPDDGQLWQHQAGALADAGYCAICPDLLGYGESDAPREIARCSVPAMATDMLALIDQLNADAVHLVGHDYGAMIAWDMALSAPERIASLSVLSVGHPAPLTEISIENLRYHWYLALANTGIGADLYLASKGCLMRELLRSHPKGAMITQRCLDDPERLHNMRRIELSMPVADLLLDRLSRLHSQAPTCHVPTLGLWGEGDDLVPERQMIETERYVAADWRYALIAGGGHWMMLRDPGAVTRALLDWIQAR